VSWPERAAEEFRELFLPLLDEAHESGVVHAEDD
jgi:hypothetical protein